MKKNKLSIKDVKKFKHLKLHRQNAIKGGRNSITGLIGKGDGFIGSAIDITVQPPNVDPLGNTEREHHGLAMSITLKG